MYLATHMIYVQTAYMRDSIEASALVMYEEICEFLLLGIKSIRVGGEYAELVTEVIGVLWISPGAVSRARCHELWSQRVIVASRRPSVPVQVVVNGEPICKRRVDIDHFCLTLLQLLHALIPSKSADLTHRNTSSVSSSYSSGYSALAVCIGINNVAERCPRLVQSLSPKRYARTLSYDATGSPSADHCVGSMTTSGMDSLSMFLQTAGLLTILTLVFDYYDHLGGSDQYRRIDAMLVRLITGRFIDESSEVYIPNYDGLGAVLRRFQDMLISTKMLLFAQFSTCNSNMSMAPQAEWTTRVYTRPYEFVRIGFSTDQEAGSDSFEEIEHRLSFFGLGNAPLDRTFFSSSDVSSPDVERPNKQSKESESMDTLDDAFLCDVDPVDDQADVYPVDDQADVDPVDDQAEIERPIEPDFEVTDEKEESELEISDDDDDYGEDEHDGIDSTDDSDNDSKCCEDESLSGVRKVPRHYAAKCSPQPAPLMRPKLTIRSDKQTRQHPSYALQSCSPAELITLTQMYESYNKNLSGKRKRLQIDASLMGDYSEMFMCCRSFHAQRIVIPAHHPFTSVSMMVRRRFHHQGDAMSMNKFVADCIVNMSSPPQDHDKVVRGVILDGLSCCASCFRASTGLSRSQFFVLNSKTDVPQDFRSILSGSQGFIVATIADAILSMVHEGYGQTLPTEAGGRSQQFIQFPYTRQNAFAAAVTLYMGKRQVGEKDFKAAYLKVESVTRSSLSRAVKHLKEEHDVTISIAKCKPFMRCTVCNDHERKMEKASTNDARALLKLTHRQHIAQMVKERHQFEHLRNKAKSVNQDEDAERTGRLL